MQFSDEALDSFSAAWKTDFGETLSRDQAQVEASKVMEFVKLVSRPLPPEGVALLEELEREQQEQIQEAQQQPDRSMGGSLDTPPLEEPPQPASRDDGTSDAHAA